MSGFRWALGALMLTTACSGSGDSGLADPIDASVRVDLGIDSDIDADGGFADPGMSDASSPDAGSVDAGPLDGGPVDAGFGPAIVSVRDQSTVARSGVRVIIGDQQGEILAEAQTDSQGLAEVMVPPGGTVTAAVPNETSGLIVFLAALDVEPGDFIAVGPRAFVPPRTRVATATITYGGPVAGAERYQLSFGCSVSGFFASADPVLIDWPLPGCPPNRSTFPVVLTARDFSETRIFAYAAADNVRISPPDALAVDLGPWQTPQNTFTARIINIPPDTASVIGEVHLNSDNEIFLSTGFDFTRDSVDTFSVSAVDIPAGEGMTVTFNVDSMQGGQRVLRRSFPVRNNVEVNTNDLLAPVTGSGIEVDDDGRIIISWITDATPNDFDVVVFVAGWQDPGSGVNLNRWRVLLPSTYPGRARLPELPLDLQLIAQPPIAAGLRTTLFDSSARDYRGILNASGFNVLIDDPRPTGPNETLRASQ